MHAHNWIETNKNDRFLRFVFTCMSFSTTNTCKTLKFSDIERAFLFLSFSFRIGRADWCLYVFFFVCASHCCTVFHISYTGTFLYSIRNSHFPYDYALLLSAAHTLFFSLNKFGSHIIPSFVRSFMYNGLCSAEIWWCYVGIFNSTVSSAERAVHKHICYANNDIMLYNTLHSAM